MSEPIKHKPLTASQKKGKSTQYRVARLILRCFNGLYLRRQAFRCGDYTMKSASGEVEFYEAGEVDKAIKRLDRLIARLSK